MLARNLLLDPERRDSPANPSNWLLYGLSGGNHTYTGKNISEEDALSSTAFWAGVRIISETIASLPLPLYVRIPKGKEKATNHYLYTLLSLMPNNEMTAFSYRESMVGNLLMWGNHYSEIDYKNDGKLELWPLLPNKMELTRRNGKLLYIYTTPDGQQAIFPKERILHIAGFSPNGIMGYNPIRKNIEALGLNLALEEYAARFFGGGGTPPMVLIHPNTLSPEAKSNLASAWQESHGGLSNSHRIAILEEGMELKEYGVKPDEAQALDSRKFSVTEVSRILNIPPPFLKDLEHATYSNIEELNKAFAEHTIRPWLVRLEQNFCVQLLSEKERKKYFWEHIMDAIVRADIQKRWEAYNKGFQTGVWSPNDIREMENKNPIEGGDKHFVQLNMIPLEQSGMRPASRIECQLRKKVKRSSLSCWYGTSESIL